MSAVAGIVRITGDGVSNKIELSAGNTNDQVVFRGLDGTTVNGKSGAVAQPVAGGMSMLLATLGAGDDLLVITSRSETAFSWPYPPVVPPLNIAQLLNVDGGEGADVLQLRDVEVGTQAILAMQGGNDIVVMESTKIGGLVLTTGEGTNCALLRDVTVTGTMTVQGGSGSDAVGLINSKFNNMVFAQLGGGGDAASVEGCTFQKQLTLFSTGAGVNQMTHGLAQINTLSGGFSSFGLLDTLERVSEVHFTYEGAEGPEHWGKLTPAFVLTDVGRQQTPIAIQTANLVQAALSSLDFAYTGLSDLPFIHNGHTIQVNFPPSPALTLQVAGNTYQLLQFHLHGPSEHTVNGQSFPLEMHLVHRDALGNLLVVTVLLKEGAANAAFDPLIANLPDHHDHTSKTIPGSFNPLSLLPAIRSYYAYSGSLTTPPGSQGVSFAIFTTAVELSAAQIAAITSAIGEPNNPPLQPVNGRVVFASSV